MNPMISEWIERLLSNNGAQSISELTRDMILDEIREIKGSIKNEKLWALGAPTEASAALHIQNIEAFKEYMAYLETLPQMLNLLVDK